MMRCAVVLLSVVVNIAAMAGTGLAAESAATSVGGSWVNGISCVPTSYHPDSGAITCAGSSIWQGAWTGVTTYEVQGVSDPKTGDLTGTITETFTGTYTADHSAGTLGFAESLRVDGATGAVRIEAEILRGAGDATFRCSAGHVTFDGFSPPGGLAAFGGWHGEWRHGCAAGASPTP